MSSNNNKQFLINQIMWLGMSLGIGIAISLLLPFPISLVTIIGVFILINFYMRKRMMQRTGMGGGRVGMFGSMSSSSPSSPSPPTSSMFGDNSLKYYCMSCGTQHKQVECPKCGSKMKKVGL
jgi:predicted permease